MNQEYEQLSHLVLLYKEHLITKSDFLIPMLPLTESKVQCCLVELHLTLQMYFPWYCKNSGDKNSMTFPPFLLALCFCLYCSLFSLTCTYYPSFQKSFNVALFIRVEFYPSLRIYIITMPIASQLETNLWVYLFSHVALYFVV